MRPEKTMTKLSPEKHAELDQQFAQARQLHMTGQQQQASEIYQRILAADPEHADALHLTGVLCLQRRQYPGAIELIEPGLLCFRKFNSFVLVAIRPLRNKPVETCFRSKYFVCHWLRQC